MRDQICTYRRRGHRCGTETHPTAPALPRIRFRWYFCVRALAYLRELDWCSTDMHVHSPHRPRHGTSACVPWRMCVCMSGIDGRSIDSCVGPACLRVCALHVCASGACRAEMHFHSYTRAQGPRWYLSVRALRVCTYMREECDQH